ncbi:MAG: ATP-binding protein [Faecousia sp.]
MKIYSMTATFGKLEHATLTLQPGLNIIEAPNEWGKSTWCAFLVAMLYGIETKAKTTKTALADKERYAPWSGSPMAGRIDLNWNGRDITIERTTKGRLIMGQFQAYETATGIAVPELDAANCGQMLLGVERSVFTRAGFLKLSDLPVTQDDSLRRRLNNLVTTGDESGAGDKLGKTLRDLKNKVRYNRSGLLPQAEAQRDALESGIAELQELKDQSVKIRSRQKELEQRISQLENHRVALQYAAAQADAQQVETAAAARNAAAENLERMTSRCEALPSREEAQQKLRAIQSLQDQWLALQMESGALPQKPAEPEIPPYYTSVSDAVAAAAADFQQQAALEQGRKKSQALVTGLLILAALVCVGTAAARFALHMMQPWIYICGGALAIFISVISLTVGALRSKRFRREMDALYDRHPGVSPDKWIPEAQEIDARQERYFAQLADYESAVSEYGRRRKALEEQTAALTDGLSISQCQSRYSQMIAAWDALGDARRDFQRAESHSAAVRAMAKSAPAPAFPDTLTDSESVTAAQLNSAAFELRQLQHKLGQSQGRMDALGQESALQAQLRAVKNRIHRLEEFYASLELAQRALDTATAELQRRFAPRIAKRAQELFGRLTGSRYDRLRLEQDLSLQAGAQGEDTLRSVQWRSDGTTDQLYLALRLAVAEELTPEAPLILDDALVRFDETRLAAALDILKEAAARKQVILFTCQSREKDAAGGEA